jgi:hypothetical protein
LNAEKKKRLDLFNSLNKNIFYILGEVNGLGLIDCIAMMMSFWLIPQNYLLSMLDNASFDRLYREPNLHNETVEKRKSSGSPDISIFEVINTFDKSVVDILKVCENIVANNAS